MNKKKTLLSAILAIAFCMSLIAGSTFALFTSESKVNIAVTSGKVSVTATLGDLQLYSVKEDENGDLTVSEGLGAGKYSYEELTGTTFTNGGTAELNGDTLTLTNVTPGDKVTFNIVVTDYSNVSVKYRTLITKSDESDDTFFNELKFDIDGRDTVGASAWNFIAGPADENGTEVKTLACSVLLPITSGNEYQEKSCAIVFTVEAVQGNAATSDVDNSAPITLAGNADDLKKALEGLKENGTVVLTKDIDLADVNWDVTAPWSASRTTITIDGGNHTIYNLTTGGTDGATYGGLLGRLATNGNVVIKDLNFENVTLKGNGTNGECAGGALVGWYENHGGSITIENVHVKNIKTENFKYAGGIIGYNSTTDSNQFTMTNCSVDGTEISGINHEGGLIGYLQGNCSITICTVMNVKINTTDDARIGRQGAIVGTMQDHTSASGVTLTNVYVNDVLVTDENKAFQGTEINKGAVSNITISNS
ncbi:MAG: hypothetical protein J6N93_02485 [Clostridia bacterium]|nr:hypothetical protein [Clostridia bacterium]